MSKKTKIKIERMVDILYAAVCIGLCLLAFKAAGYIYPFLVALALVAVFNPLVQFLHRKMRINQKAVSVIMLALLYIIIGLLIFWGATQIMFLLQRVFDELPGYYRSSIAPALEHLTDSVGNLSEKLPMLWSEEIASIWQSLMNALKDLIGTISSKGISAITGFVNQIPGFLISLIFTILLSFFISVQYDNVIGFAKSQLSVSMLEKVYEIKILLKQTVFKYMKAILILILCTFIELSIGLLILGVSNPIGKAGGIALFDALPIFGTGGIMIPWILSELLSQHYTLAAGLSILYVIVTVVRNIIEPKIVGDQLGINPIVSLISIYLGYRLMGVVGMILFPIVAQVLLALHQSGTIRLYREEQVNESNRVKDESEVNE